MKGTFFGLLILVLMGAQAAVKAQFEYTVNADGATITITNYSGPGGAVTIPTSINGLSVSSLMGTWSPLIGGQVSITSSAFGSCSNLTSVTIPNSVTSIGEGAFNSCANLVDVAIPNSVTNIGNWAFSGCHSLASIAIPDSVASIGKGAFCDCISLKSVRIPDSVTSIGNWAFSECPSLTNAVVGNGITRIGCHDFGFGLFHHCADLQAVCFKGNAPDIGGGRVVFGGDDNAIVYYLADTTGWGPTFGGRPTKVWEP